MPVRAGRADRAAPEAHERAAKATCALVGVLMWAGRLPNHRHPLIGLGKTLSSPAHILHLAGRQDTALRQIASLAGNAGNAGSLARVPFQFRSWPARASSDKPLVLWPVFTKQARTSGTYLFLFQVGRNVAHRVECDETACRSP